MQTWKRMFHRRPGSTLLEAVVALAILSAIALTASGTLHAGRAATRRAVHAIEAASLAEHLASAFMAHASENGLEPELRREGKFGVPFREYHWRIERTAGTSGPCSLTVLVRSTDASITLYVW